MLAPHIRSHGRAPAHIAAFHMELAAMRRDRSAIVFETHHTAQRMGESLWACNDDEIQTGVGTTGVVALMHGKGRASAQMMELRADMDTLTIAEHNDVA